MGQLWAEMFCCSIQDDVINYMDHMVNKTTLRFTILETGKSKIKGDIIWMSAESLPPKSRSR